MPDGIFHGIQVPGVAIEVGQIQPSERSAVAVRDGGAILILGRDEILVLFGEACLYPSGSDRIHGGDFLRLSFRLVASAAHNPRSLQVEFGQIGASLGAVGIQTHGGFKFAANFLCQPRRSQETGMVGFFPINTSQPEMILSVVRIEGHSFLAC